MPAPDKRGCASRRWSVDKPGSNAPCSSKTRSDTTTIAIGANATQCDLVVVFVSSFEQALSKRKGLHGDLKLAGHVHHVKDHVTH